MRALVQRQAFTLVELLVVIAIIGILISMLLPALGTVRARAQAVKCQVNLSSIAKAMYTYSRQGLLPKGIDTEKRHTGLTALLPYLEGRNLFDQFDFDMPVDVSPPVTATSFPAYLCPSDRPTGTWTSAGGGTYSRSNYVMCFGAGGLEASTDNAGVFRLDRMSSFTAMNRDGATNTAMLSEVVAGVGSEPGGTWAYGDAGASAYTHKSPPNSGPHILVDSGVDWPDAEGVASSHHTGGVHVVFGDGHVEFINETISPDVWTAYGTAAGQEPVFAP